VVDHFLLDTLTLKNVKELTSMDKMKKAFAFPIFLGFLIFFGLMIQEGLG
jgi:hypothetical protein